MDSNFVYIDLKKERNFRREFDKIGYNFYERMKNYFEVKVKSLFLGKKGLDSLAE